MLKKLLLGLLVIASITQASEYQRVSRFVITNQDGQKVEIQRCFVDAEIRDIPAHLFNKAIKHYAIRVVSVGNGEYGLRAHVKGNGGGPLSATPAAMAASGAVWASYAAICSAEGPVCVAHLPEFHTMAAAAFNTTYWAVFFCPWLP